MLLSVADHHARSISRGSNKRVVGVLLGQDNGKTVNVANSFGIPFEEDEKDSKTWFLDHNYIEGMWEMFKKVNGEYLNISRWIKCAEFTITAFIARERMIGWYHTGPKLRASDQEINDLFKRFIARPVMVIVDVRPQTVGIPTDAYFAVEEIKDVSAFEIVCTVQVFRSGSSYRMEPRHVKPSYMSRQQSRPRKPKRSAWSTSFEISKTRQQQRSQPASQNN